MRDITAAVDMTPGAVYFHIATKHQLLLLVYEEGVNRMMKQLDEAIANVTDPMVRLEHAVVAHLRAILDANAYARVVVRILPDDVPEIAAELRDWRELYENKIRHILAAIELPAGRDRNLLRLFLIGALNWMPVWYKGNGNDIPAIAAELLAQLSLKSPQRGTNAR